MATKNSKKKIPSIIKQNERRLLATEKRFAKWFTNYAANDPSWDTDTIVELGAQQFSVSLDTVNKWLVDMQTKEKAMSEIQIILDVQSIQNLIRTLKPKLECSANLRKRFLKLIKRPSEVFRIERRRTSGTRELRYSLEPTKLLQKFVAAIRTGDRE